MVSLLTERPELTPLIGQPIESLSDDLFSLLTDLGQDGEVVVDDEGIITDVNDDYGSPWHWVYVCNGAVVARRDANDPMGGEAPDGWVRATQLGTVADYYYTATVRRIQNTPKLAAHEDTILYDWPEGDEHWQWAATAPVAEIVAWAESVEAAEQS